MFGSSFIAKFPLTMNGPRRKIHLHKRFTRSNDLILPVYRLRRSREQHFADSRKHTQHTQQHRHATRNTHAQKKKTETDASFATSLHQSFLRHLPCSGIVHHLSGVNTCGLVQPTRKITVGCRCACPSIHFSLLWC